MLQLSGFYTCGEFPPKTPCQFQSQTFIGLSIGI